MTSREEPFWLTRDGRYKVRVDGQGTAQAAVLYSWSDEAGTAGDWVEIVRTQSTGELHKHIDEGSLHEFTVPDYPPDMPGMPV